MMKYVEAEQNWIDQTWSNNRFNRSTPSTRSTPSIGSPAGRVNVEATGLEVELGAGGLSRKAGRTLWHTERALKAAENQAVLNVFRCIQCI